MLMRARVIKQVEIGNNNKSKRTLKLKWVKDEKAYDFNLNLNIY
jgi:hypothetical protein